MATTVKYELQKDRFEKPGKKTNLNNNKWLLAFLPTVSSETVSEAVTGT